LKKGVDAVPESFSQDDLEQIRQLLNIVSENNLCGLEVSQRNGFSFAATTDAGLVQGASVYAAAPVALPASPAVTSAPIAASKAVSANRIALKAPMVGTFFASQTPGDPPFVKVGDTVSPGQTIGLIEAMKVYSEIPAEQGGRVVEICVKSGQLVQSDQPLFFVEP
jgi:acetyl-CoA carboxylase biotin carboxyl carrier protein